MNAVVRGNVPATPVSRRALLKGSLALAAALGGGRVVPSLPVLAEWTHLIIDLGPGGEGGDWSTANAVNGAGQVLWTWATAIDADMGTVSNAHPCIWEQGAVRDLSLLGLTDLAGIAADGTVIGSTGPQAVRVLPGAAAPEPLPGFGKDAYATAISPSGLIGGVIGGRPVILRDGGLRDLPIPEGFGYFHPAAISDTGQVVGVARVERSRDEGQRGAVVSQDGSVDVLAPAPGGESSAAVAINASGHVAGGPAAAGMHSIRGRGRAFRHDLATNETLDLGTLPGYANSFATGIDAAGRVIGMAWDAAPNKPFRAAWVWSEAAGMIDLNSLLPEGAGWLLSDAHGINDTGLIVGQGGYMGQRRGFLLLPVETI